MPIDRVLPIILVPNLPSGALTHLAERVRAKGHDCETLVKDAATAAAQATESTARAAAGLIKAESGSTQPTDQIVAGGAHTIGEGFIQTLAGQGLERAQSANIIGAEGVGTFGDKFIRIIAGQGK